VIVCKFTIRSVFEDGIIGVLLNAVCEETLKFHWCFLGVLKVRVELECVGSVSGENILEQCVHIWGRVAAFPESIDNALLRLVYDSSRRRSVGRREVDTEMWVVSHDSVSRSDDAGEVCDGAN
jgi:hypothetical protein